MKTVTYESQYSIDPGQDIRLRVMIGEGQFGSTIVTVANKIFDHVHDFDVVLGKGSELKGQTVKAVSVVTDTNLQTNRTSVTYRLSGGSTSLEHTIALVVDNEQESVVYDATFTLE